MTDEEKIRKRSNPMQKKRLLKKRGAKFMIIFAVVIIIVGTAAFALYLRSISNTPPNIPNNPTPTNGALNADININLIWTGGDSNSADTVTYDVYFGTTNPPTTKVSANQTDTTFDPGTLMNNTVYYWKIIAEDNHGSSAVGPIWNFTAIKPTGAHNRYAVIDTTMGTIKVELYEDKMPITTANFIKLANDGFYSGLVFHRVIDNFMIQGGGFYPNGTQKQDKYGPIKLETSPDVLHVDGAISMARLSSPVDSATSQFFICDGAQSSLDGQYAAFGKVVDGLDVVKAIAAVPTGTKTVGGYPMSDWPVTDVLINSVTIENS